MAWQDFGILEAQILIAVAATIAYNMLSRRFLVAVLLVSGRLLWAGAPENCLHPQVTNIIRFTK